MRKFLFLLLAIFVTGFFFIKVLLYINQRAAEDKVKREKNNLDRAVATLRNVIKEEKYYLISTSIQDVMKWRLIGNQQSNVKEILVKAIEARVSNYLKEKYATSIDGFICETVKNNTTIIEIPEVLVAVTNGMKSQIDYYFDEGNLFSINYTIEQLTKACPNFVALSEIKNLFVETQERILKAEDKIARSAIVVWQEKWREKLPIDFSGSRIRELFTQINEIKHNEPTKDEFTTKENHTTKLKEYYKNAKFGYAAISDQIVFTIPRIDAENDSVGFRKFGYDAELQQFYFFASGANIFDRKVINLGQYTGENAFGVKKVVIKKRIESWKVEFKLPKDWMEIRRYKTSLKPLSGNGNLKVDMIYQVSPETAKTIKDKIGAAFIVSLVSPFVEKSYSRETATITSPQQISYARNIIHAHLDKVILYRTDTMEILATRDYERSKE